MEKEIPSVIRLLEQSANSSEESLKILGLEDGFFYVVPKSLQPQQRQLQARNERETRTARKTLE